MKYAHCDETGINNAVTIITHIKNLEVFDELRSTF